MRKRVTDSRLQRTRGRPDSHGRFDQRRPRFSAAARPGHGRHAGLVTISLGSGPNADVMFVFSSDICGESPRTPRHARAYADLAAMRAEIDRERVRALSAFRSDVATGAFPTDDEVVKVDADVISHFVNHAASD